jgi:hypothetical protein
MPLPAAGNSISISQIRTELATSSGSLRTLSSLAGFSTPDAMSEFYSYSASVTVNIDVYLPTYVGCYNSYTFAATSSVVVNTNLNVGIAWYGDLGGYFPGSVTIPSGAACNSATVDTGGGVNCIGEYRVNEFWSMFPTTSGGQNYFPGNAYSDLYPC